MSVEVSPVTYEGMTHIVRNLRPRDRAEIFALRWDDDDEAFVRQVCSVAGEIWRMWWLDGEPIAVNGTMTARPGVVIVGAFGTHKWRAALRPITRYTLEYAIPLLKRAGYHRGEAYVLAANTDSRRWIEMLGGEVEGYLRGFGRAREDFLLYAWDLTKGDEHVLRRRRQRAVRPQDDHARCH